MGDLFSGLEGFGLDKFKNINVYEKEDKEKNKKKETEKEELTEEDFIFDKTYTCPVCDNEFRTKMIKTGRIKLISVETDLRPKYQFVDSLKYDAILCPRCGYAALNRYFNYIMAAQSKLIKENISMNFRDIEPDEKFISYDTAISRHKLALLNAIVKKGKDSEKAYICLKLAWLLRGKGESLPKEKEGYEKEMEALHTEEVDFLSKAYDGFIEAYSKEDFPMCGMDRMTTTYLIAELARRIGNFEESSRWISRVLIAKDANKRIRDKAMVLKEALQKEQAKNN